MFNSRCSCIIQSQITTHFFLRCHFYNANWAILINDLENIDQSLATLSEVNLVDLLLCDNEQFYGKILRYKIQYKIPRRLSNICMPTVINLFYFWCPITYTNYPPFPSFLKHFPQVWLPQFLVFVFSDIYYYL